MGINVDTTISLTFLLGGMLAGAAGLIYALYQTTIWYFQGFTAGLIAFTAAVMGGIGNLRGAVLGGLIIGFIQQISDNRIGSEWTPAIVFAYLVLIMVFKPPGCSASRRGRPDDHRRRRECEPKPGGRRAALPPWTEKALVPVVAAAARRSLPFFFDSGSSFIEDCTLALAYVVMALGLNIIVGFAGLLDLGYVAFFAIGAFTIGWLGLAFRLERRRGAGHPRRRRRRAPRSCPAST